MNDDFSYEFTFSAVVDLSSVTSPYSGSTADLSNSIATSCGGNGNEAGFSIVVQSGASISIGMTTNGFDSRHELSYGGAFPGATSVVCRDDPDTQTEEWTNETGEAQTVYFLIDAYSSGSGSFTLAWTITRKAKKRKAALGWGRGGLLGRLKFSLELHPPFLPPSQSLARVSSALMLVTYKENVCDLILTYCKQLGI